MPHSSRFHRTHRGDRRICSIGCGYIDCPKDGRCNTCVAMTDVPDECPFTVEHCVSQEAEA